MRQAIPAVLYLQSPTKFKAPMGYNMSHTLGWVITSED